MGQVPIQTTETDDWKKKFAWFPVLMNYPKPDDKTPDKILWLKPYYESWRQTITYLYFVANGNQWQTSESFTTFKRLRCTEEDFTVVVLTEDIHQRTDE